MSLNTYTIFFIACCFVLACGNNTTPKKEKAASSTSGLSFEEARAELAEGRKLVEEADSLHQADAKILSEQVANQGYDRLIRLSKVAPNYRNAAAGLIGQAAYYGRNYPAAKEWLKEAMELDNRDVKSLMWLGLAHLATSQPDSAQSYFAKSINYYDHPAHRARLVSEIYAVGQTAYEYGVSYDQDGYPQKGFDYKVYGTYVTSMAYELDKEDSKPESKSQVLTYAQTLLPQAIERKDTPRVQFFNNIINNIK
ncbi:MAG: tetratricopeptide repeat protein [Bacteroidia bacterium]